MGGELYDRNEFKIYGSSSDEDDRRLCGWRRHYFLCFEGEMPERGTRDFSRSEGDKRRPSNRFASRPDQRGSATEPDAGLGAEALGGAYKGSTTSLTLPDPEIGLQHFTVGSPQPFSGYESSNFYYTGFGLSQDIPGPGKLGLRAEQARKEAEVAQHALEVQQRQVVEQVRETYFNLFYLKKTLDVLLETQGELQSIEQSVEAQYHVGMVQQQDCSKRK